MPAEINGWLMPEAEMVENGRLRLEMIRDAIREHRRLNHGPYKTPPSLLPSYDAVVDPPTKPALGDAIIDMIGKHGDPDTGYIMVEVNNTRPDARVPAPYLNYVHKDGRAIMCMYNFKKQDSTPSVQQLKWTDVLAATCVHAMNHAGRNATTSGTAYRLYYVQEAGQEA